MSGHKVERSSLERVVVLGQKTGYALIATADGTGRPHLAAVGMISAGPENHLLLEEWFCPGTVSNLRVNPNISVVVWDAEADSGYQVIGELEELKDTGFLGCDTGESGVPQVARQISLHVDRIIEFKRAPHTDLEEVGI